MTVEVTTQAKARSQSMQSGCETELTSDIQKTRMTTRPQFLVTLVRHGETHMNVLKLMQGHTDAPLSELGVVQAQKLGRYVKSNNITFSSAYASDLQRAHKTAQYILEEAGSDITVHKEVNLRERAYGDAEGKPFAEYVERAKQANLKLSKFVAPGGESIADVRSRVEDVFEKICSQSKSIERDQNLLVVSHGGWIQCFMYYLYENQLRFKLKNFAASSAVRSIHHNTGVTQMLISPLTQEDNQEAEYQVEFLRMNDISHLT